MQNSNLLQSSLWSVVQFTEQCADKLTYNANNYNDYNNYNTTGKCDFLSSTKISAELIMKMHEGEYNTFC